MIHVIFDFNCERNRPIVIRKKTTSLGTTLIYLCRRLVNIFTFGYILKSKIAQHLYSALYGTWDHFIVLRHRSHNSTCKKHYACLYLVSVQQMAPLPIKTANCSSLLIYRPREDKRLSWLNWLTSSGRFAHISGYSSAEGRACDRVRRPRPTFLPLCHATSRE